jgi:hypothetical protein
MCFEGMDWINLAQDRDKLRAFLNMDMNVSVSYSMGSFFTNWANISLSRSLPHVVTNWDIPLFLHTLFTAD